MHYLELAVLAAVLGLAVLSTRTRVRKTKRRGRSQRARHYWAAYEYAWAIVYGRQRLKRLPYFERIEETAE
jgi:hypothetical protein